MKKAFFEYIGAEDSLAGYQKSNRLVLLKALFSLIDNSGAALVSEVTKSYKRYYETRKRNGFIPDVGADIVISNIEDSSDSDLLTVIKRHPFRVLNEKGYLTISRINNLDYFTFNDELMDKLTDSDIQRLAQIIDRKLHLYFSKRDADYKEMDDEAIICHSSSIEVDSLNTEFKCDTLAANSVALTDNFFNDNQLVSIYNTFVSQYKKGVKYILLDDLELGFTASDLRLISKNDDLFYLCSSKRALLIIWIVQAIDKLFDTEKGVLTVNEIYNFLRQQFIPSFNKKNLIKLLNCDDRITISQFSKIKRIADDKVNAIFTSDSDRAPYVEEWNVKKFGQAPISDILRSRVEFLLGINDHDKCVEKELSAVEYNSLQLYDRAIKEAGIEICRWGYQFPGETIALMEALSVFSRLVDSQRQRIDVMIHNYDNIAFENRCAKVEPLILAYTKDSKIQSDISSCVFGCKYVSELNKVIEFAAENNDNSNKLNDFLTWLQKDIRKSLKYSMADIYKSERSFQVVQARALGATLEEVGGRFGLTRERIRQIEIKVEHNFSSFYSRCSPAPILSAFSKSYAGFDENDIHNIFEDNVDIFSYFVKKKKAYHDLIWVDELSIFFVGDASWYETIKNEIENLPEQILSSQMIDQAIEVRNRLNLLIDAETLRKIIVSFYKQVGEYYTKSRMSKKDMYKVIIERYYPDGMKLFNDFEMMRFKTHFEDIFGIANTDDTRAICARITDFTILCDRGKYILPSAIQINSQLLDDIRQFVVNHERSNIMFAEIFERFKLRIKEESNIHNRYFLQGTLKYYWNDEFNFSRDTISRNSGDERSIRSHLESFVKARNGTVTIKDIKDEFLGITDIVINMAFADNCDILLWDVAEYIHASLINIDDVEAEMLKKALDTEIIDGTVSTSALYAHIYDREPSLLNDNKIYNHTALFSVYRYLFPDEYSFSRPFISCGDTGMTTDSVMDDYVANFDELSIADLKLFFEEKHIKVMNISAMIEKNCADFLRVDDDQLIRTSKLSITENLVDDLQNSIISTLGDKGYMPAKDYDDFFFFPYIGIKWTSHLLVAIIKKYCDKLSVSKYTIDHRYLTDIIYKNSLGIKNHEELISYAIRLENSRVKFENTADIESFLKTEGLIAVTGSILQTLYEKGIVEITEFGELKIN